MIRVLPVPPCDSCGRELVEAECEVVPAGGGDAEALWQCPCGSENVMPLAPDGDPDFCRLVPV